MYSEELFLETPRLYLREMTSEDAPFILALNADPEVIQYVGELPLKDIKEAENVLYMNILPQYKRYGMGRLLAELKSSGEAIGWCGIKWDADKECYDLGYRFFKKHWGQGYATESAKAVLEWGHTERKLTTIIGKADILNVGSVHVLEKLGMKFEQFSDECHGKTAVYTSDIR
ncbi:MAG: GNAT family N-acetyltransferase [Bacteroidia bacterium]